MHSSTMKPKNDRLLKLMVHCFSKNNVQAFIALLDGIELMAVPKPSLKEKFKMGMDDESRGLFLYEYWFLRHPKISVRSKAVYIANVRCLDLVRPQFFENNYKRSARGLKPLVKSYLLAQRKRAKQKDQKLAA